MTKSVVSKRVKDADWRCDRAEYVLSYNSKQVGNNMERWNKMTISWDENYVGGWDKDGNLILIMGWGFDVNCLNYIGYVKDGEVVFDEGCGLE